jgi:hypothetical protein
VNTSKQSKLNYHIRISPIDKSLTMVIVYGVGFVTPYQPNHACQICRGTIVREQTEVDSNAYLGKICYACEKAWFYRGRALNDQGIKDAAALHAKAVVDVK